MIKTKSSSLPSSRLRFSGKGGLVIYERNAVEHVATSGTSRSPRSPLSLNRTIDCSITSPGMVKAFEYTGFEIKEETSWSRSNAFESFISRRLDERKRVASG